jgi:mannose-1-phosphate guanylyltransferase
MNGKRRTSVRDYPKLRPEFRYCDEGSINPLLHDSGWVDENVALCGIVLAGGEGKRLQSLIQRLRGDTLPKQFVNFIGEHSMLERAFLRAETLIPPNRIFTVVNWSHLKYPEVRRQISRRPKGSVVVQPEDKETGPGLLLPLMHLYKRYPESTVVIFPSGHFILEERIFMSCVHLAYRAVERDPSRLVLLGVEPDRPEPEYGYIVPSKKLIASPGIFAISQFVEKPAFDTAQELILRGGLWNTMVMVFRASTLLYLLCRHFSAIYARFQRIKEAIGSPFEKAVVQETYSGIDPVNFSRDMLQLFAKRHPSRFLALAVKGVSWSDWGSEYRITDTLKKIAGMERSWAAIDERFVTNVMGTRADSTVEERLGSG